MLIGLVFLSMGMERWVLLAHKAGGILDGSRVAGVSVSSRHRHRSFPIAHFCCNLQPAFRVQIRQIGRFMCCLGLHCDLALLAVGLYIFNFAKIIYLFQFHSID